MVTTVTKSYGVTPEQIDACDRYVHENTGEVFYLVKSATTDGVYYRVTWNKQYRCLACTCQAAQTSLGCWHRRAVREANQQYRKAKQAEQVAQERQAQEHAAMLARIEAANQHPTVYTEAEIKAAQYLNQPNEFKLLR